MKRKEALDAIMKTVSRYDVIISSTGLICRELYEYHDSEQQFYIPGSMGLASSVGLGIALSKPNKRVVVVDGDASLLMNLGSMVTIGHFAPKNLTHILLDNRAYASCSEEPTISDTARLGEIAKIVGYRAIYDVDNEQKLEEAIKSSYDNDDLTFVLAHIELGGRRNLARPLELESIKNRFKKFLSD